MQTTSHSSLDYLWSTFSIFVKYEKICRKSFKVDSFDLWCPGRWGAAFGNFESFFGRFGDWRNTLESCAATGSGSAGYVWPMGHECLKIEFCTFLRKKSYQGPLVHHARIHISTRLWAWDPHSAVGSVKEWYFAFKTVRNPTFKVFLWGNETVVGFYFFRVASNTHTHTQYLFMRKNCSRRVSVSDSSSLTHECLPDSGRSIRELGRFGVVLVRVWLREIGRGVEKKSSAPEIRSEANFSYFFALSASGLNFFSFRRSREASESA